MEYRFSKSRPSNCQPFLVPILSIMVSICKSSFVTNDTASTINLSDAPTTGMWLTILVIADVAVAIDDNDVGAVLIWKDGSSGSTLTCSGSSGESVTLFWDGTKWRAILIEGSWTLS